MRPGSTIGALAVRQTPQAHPSTLRPGDWVAEGPLRTAERITPVVRSAGQPCAFGPSLELDPNPSGFEEAFELALLARPDPQTLSGFTQDDINDVMLDINCTKVT